MTAPGMRYNMEIKEEQGEEGNRWREAHQMVCASLCLICSITALFVRAGDGAQFIRLFLHHHHGLQPPSNNQAWDQYEAGNHEGAV